MNRYIVSFSNDCEDALSKVGNIIFKTDLDLNFLGLETNLSEDEVMKIDGVTKCRKERIGRLCI